MSAEILRRAASLMRERAENVPDANVSDHRISGMWLNSAHYLTTTPAVALAVADWLEKTAVAVDHGGSHALFITEAVTVARAYLGESA